MPALPLGKGRAFFDTPRRIAARIRHRPDIALSVFARIEGAQHGSMAGMMRRRIGDARLEPAADAA